MTDKEIIIDGVVVSECSYYSSETYPYTCEVWDNECEAQNCYYKQLKRLEQKNAELKAENERLKHQYADVLKLAKENADSNEFCLQELEKEYEYLKKCCTQAGEELEKHSFKWDGKEKNLVIQAMELNEQFSQLEKENEQYKQTLQEIKKIAEKGKDSVYSGKNYCIPILDLITKAESEG